MSIGILGGTLLATGLKALFDIFSTKGANQYNSPASQLKRLRKAGLPLSYMYQGRVNQQTTVPQLSIDPNLGTLDKLKGEQIRTETKGKEIENEIQSGLLKWLKKDSGDGSGSTNQELLQEYNLKSSEANAFLAKHEQELKQIELWVENNAFKEGITMEARRQALKKAQQQITNLLKQAGLMDQLYQIRGLDQLLNSSLVDQIDSYPEWLGGLMKIILIATKRSSH